jgi:sulfite reductase (ferredoxin)
MRVSRPDGEVVEGFQVHLDGGLGLDAGMGRKLRGHKVASDELHEYITRVVTRFLQGRQPREVHRLGGARRRRGASLALTYGKPLQH